MNVASSFCKIFFFPDFKWYRPLAVSMDDNDDAYITDNHRLIRIPVDNLKEHADVVTVITGSKG